MIRFVPLALLSAFLLHPATAWADAIRYGGASAELSISEVSDRTVRIVLAPLDEQGKPRPAPASTVLVDFPEKLKLRCRDLSGPEEVALTKLRVKLRPEPLAIVIT